MKVYEPRQDRRAAEIDALGARSFDRVVFIYRRDESVLEQHGSARHDLVRQYQRGIAQQQLSGRLVHGRGSLRYNSLRRSVTFAHENSAASFFYVALSSASGR